MNVPNDRKAASGRLVERRVPHREERVAQAKDRANDALVRLLEKVRLATLGVDVRMCAEEGTKRADLVPTYEHLRFRVTEETADISYNITSAKT